MPTKALTHDFIEQKIYLIRGQKVMIDSDLALLYGVTTGQLNQQVKRNKDRFPEDFMFQLTKEEAEALRSQFVILNEGSVGSRSQIVILNKADLRSQNVTLKKGKNIKYLPYAFTEQGIAMLSSVLKSKQAVVVNIAIMRTFVKLRHMISLNKEVSAYLKELEKKVGQHDHEIRAIFEVLRRLTEESHQLPLHLVLSSTSSNFWKTKFPRNLVLR